MLAWRFSAAGLLCLLALMPALAGCGGSEGEAAEAAHEEPIREGLSAELAGLDYTVFITRELNLKDPEDADYYRGPPAPPGSALYGVFIDVCNEGDQPAPAARDFKVVNAQEEEFRPVALADENIFAYRPARLPGKQCIPDELSIPATAPTGGALLIFRLPLAATEDRPLELEIEDPTGKHEPLVVELDI